MIKRQLLRHCCYWVIVKCHAIKTKKSAGSPLLQFEEPIYGSFDTDFTTFITPGAVLRSVVSVSQNPRTFPRAGSSIVSTSHPYSITFYLAVGLTALSFVLERKEGLLDRCWVAGEEWTNSTLSCFDPCWLSIEVCPRSLLLPDYPQWTISVSQVFFTFEKKIVLNVILVSKKPQLHA